jgi:hypothetical protein
MSATTERGEHGLFFGGSMYSRCPRCGWKLSDKNFAKEVRESYPRAFSPWKPEEDKKLEELVAKGVRITEMAAALGRQPSAVQRRIDVLKIREVAGCTPIKDDSMKYLNALPLEGKLGEGAEPSTDEAV